LLNERRGQRLREWAEDNFQCALGYGRIEIREVNDGDCQFKARSPPHEQGKTIAIESMIENNFISHFQQRPQGRTDRSHAGHDGKSRVGVLQTGAAFLKKR
jgi:hypothetical protein